MSGSDDLKARRARLMAMREKFNRDDDMDIGGEEDFDDFEESDAAPARRGGGRRRGAGGGGGGGQGAIVKRVVQFLKQPGPGGKLIPGTDIKEDRLKQAMQFLRHRSRMAEGSRGKRMQRLLQHLTQENPGDTMVSGVNVSRLTQLMAMVENRGLGKGGGGGGFLGGGGRRRGGMGMAGGADDELIDELEDADEYADEDEAEEGGSHMEGIESTLQQLVGITHRLSAQLEETQKQVDQMARERGDDGAEEGEEGTRGSRGKSDWFTEYLE